MKAGFTFNTVPPSKRLDSQMGVGIQAAASISDSVGNLLFYTNGDSCWSANHIPMPHGKRIRFDSVTSYPNSAIIIPWAGQARKYWVFYCGRPPSIPFPKPPDWYNHAICGYVVDMNLNHGLGDVDTTSKIRLYRYGEALLTCMLHADGKSIWLVGRRFDTDTLMAWKIDSSGLNTNPVKSKVFYNEHKFRNNQSGFYFDDGWTGVKASPNSEMLFWGWQDERERKNLLLKFNRMQGTFSDKIGLIDSVGLNNRSSDVWPVDGIFSPDSRFLYTCESLYWKPYGSIPNSQNKRLSILRRYALDIWDSAAIKNSAEQIYKTPMYPVQGPSTGYLNGQLGPDGKLYFQQYSSSKLSVINCPSSAWDKVNFQYQKIDIERDGGFRLPTLNQTFVRNAGIFQLQANKRSICQGDTLELSGYGAGAEHFTWSVSPAFPQTTKLDTLTWQRFSTKNIPPGSYSFSCKATSRCGDVYEKSMVVEVNPLPENPVFSTLQKPVSCAGDTVLIAVQNVQPGYLYQWKTGSQSTSIKISQTGKYYLDSVVTDKGCVRRGSDTLRLNFRSEPVPPSPVLSPLLIEICEGKTTPLTLDNGLWTVLWSNGQTGNSITIPAGKYTALYETPGGCRSATSDTIEVVKVPLPVVQIIALDSLHCEGNEEEKQYKVESQNVKVKSIEVQGGEMVSQSDSMLTIRWHSVVNCQLSIVNSNRLGCQGPTATFRPKTDVEICRSLYPLFIPNLVTPNGDTRNEYWELGNLFYYQPVSLSIYNRWGKRIFETSNYHNNWPEDGLAPGTYFYRMVVSGEDNSHGGSQSGWIEVVK